MAISTGNAGDGIKFILDGLQKTIEKEADELIEQEKKNLVEKLERMKIGVVANYILKVSEWVSVQDFGHEIRITVKKEKLEDTP